MRRRTRCMDGTTRTAARSRLQAEMGLRSSWVVVTSSFLLRSLCLGPEINSFHTPKLTFCLFPRVLSPKRCCSSQRGFIQATPICTTVVQIKRARLEDASRTTLPETLFEHTPFLNLKTPRPTTTPPQHHHTHNTTRKRPYVSPSTPTRVWRI